MGVEGSGSNEKSGLKTMLGYYNRGSISNVAPMFFFFLSLVDGVNEGQTPNNAITRGFLLFSYQRYR